MEDRMVHVAVITAMENREEGRLFVLFLFCLHFIPDIGSSQRIVFINNSTRWRDAHEYCKSLNGSLASTEDLQSATIPDCARNMGTVWIGNIAVVTPMLSLKACVNASEKSVFDKISHSVEQCAALCSSSIGFEIQRQRCKCLDNEIPTAEVNASQCINTCKEGDEMQFCGGENVSNIYTFLDSGILKESNPGEKTKRCTFASCGEKKDEKYLLTVSRCVDQTNFPSAILCNEDGTDSFPGNVSNWRDACLKCIRRNGRYPIDVFRKEQCCPGADCIQCNNMGAPIICFSTWTSTRQYEGNIVAYDMELQKFVITRCSYARISSNITSVLYDWKLCEAYTGRNIACKLDSIDQETFSCFTSSSTNPSSSSSSTSIAMTTKTEVLPTDDNLLSTPEMTQQENKEDESSLGMIIGVSLGALASLATMIIVLIIWRRGCCFIKQDNKQENTNRMNSIPNVSVADHTRDVIYQSTSDGEYDHINVKRKYATDTKIETDVYNHVTNTHGLENVENNYDQMSNHKDQNMTESTYYSHAKTQNPASQGETSNEYDVTGPLQILANRTIDVENAYDVCSKSGISQS